MSMTTDLGYDGQFRPLVSQPKKRLCACWEYDITGSYGILDIIGTLHTATRCSRIEKTP